MKKNEIKIYNIMKQTCFNDLKKETKFKKRKPIKITAKFAWARGGKINMSFN